MIDTPKMKASKIEAFKTTVYAFYKQQGRSFPWREGDSPWGVLVSEFMLQQTQTERVVPYYERWMQRWSSPEALNGASLEEALREWVGLGYNRRCRFLKETSRIIVEEFGGQVPSLPEQLVKLPGIGVYTASAVACFAYNHPSVFIETNIRAAVIDFFFTEKVIDANGTVNVEKASGTRQMVSNPSETKDEALSAVSDAGNKTSGVKVSDAELVPILDAALDRENPRIWYWALMDYGAFLKKASANPSRRSAAYTKQSKFEGSFRQRRGRVVRALVSEGGLSDKDLTARTGMTQEELYPVLAALKQDSMVAEENGVYRIKG